MMQSAQIEIFEKFTPDSGPCWDSTLDGSRLEGLVLRRTNGSFQAQNAFSVSLSLDPLTNDPELVGREIRNHLDADRSAGAPLHCRPAAEMGADDSQSKCRRCRRRTRPAFCNSKPSAVFLAIVQTLHLATSRCQTIPANSMRLLVGIPRNHLAVTGAGAAGGKIEAGELFAWASPPCSRPSPGGAGVLALAIGENHVGLQITSGGGVAALRALEGALEAEGGQRALHADRGRARGPDHPGPTAGRIAGGGPPHPRFRPARPGPAIGG